MYIKLKKITQKNKKIVYVTNQIYDVTLKKYVFNLKHAFFYYRNKQVDITSKTKLFENRSINKRDTMG